MARRIVTAREQFEMSAPWRVAAVPEFPQFGHQIPDAPGKHPDDFWGSGGCGAMALAFKNMWPDLKIGADVDNKDGTLNHAWVHDGKRAHDYMGTHPDPHGPSGQWPNFTHYDDMDPAHLASIMGHKWSEEDPWVDDTVNDAAGEIEGHWLDRHYDPETGEYFSKRHASTVDDIMDLLGGPSTPPPPRKPSPPPDPDRYYNHLKQQEDRTHTAHAWLPTEVVNHYREYDRPTDNSDYRAVKRAVSEDGVKQPLWISANDTHGLLVEGNNRLKAAQELGITHLPVRFTYNPTVMSNEGNPPVPHHPAVRGIFPQIKSRLARRVMSGVTLFTKPGCYGCKGTARELDKHGIPFVSRDVTQDPEAYAMVQQLGYQQLPVVHAGDDNHWSGHSPDRIKSLVGQ